MEFVNEANTIVMEFAPNGTLQHCLQSLSQPIGIYLKTESEDWVTRLKWTMQLAETIRYLHSRGK